MFIRQLRKIMGWQNRPRCSMAAYFSDGGAVRRARAGMRLSQEALAVDADLDRSYVGGIERGEHNLTVMNIVKIAAALQIKPSELLGSAGL